MRRSKKTRVTKTVKEYIVREVSKKYDTKIEDLRNNHPATIETKEFEKAIQEIAKTANTKAQEYLAKYHITNMYGRELIDSFGSNAYHFRHEQENELRNKISELQDARAKAIENILLNLELGGATLNELNEMIANA